MQKINVEKLEAGIYRIHWKLGGSSLAAIGDSSDGKKWIAVTECDKGSTTDRSVWKAVCFAHRLSLALN